MGLYYAAESSTLDHRFTRKLSHHTSIYESTLSKTAPGVGYGTTAVYASNSAGIADRNFCTRRTSRVI